MDQSLWVRMQVWVLFVTLGLVYLGNALTGTYHFVAIPAILESGDKVKFCAKLAQPDEKLTMTLTLMSKKSNTTVFKRESTEQFALCDFFMAPIVAEDEVQELLVEVSGQNYHSQEVRKLFIKANQELTIIQTDKPIYLPGQTVLFRVVTLDTMLRPGCRKYDIIELEDANGNRIGQWLNHTAKALIVQLAHPLNAEAKEGTYRINVYFGKDQLSHDFKVEKYVLPKFDVQITTDDEVSIGQKEISIKLCSKYTYRQPVPGKLKIDICRPVSAHIFRPPGPVIGEPEEGFPEVAAPCYREVKQADKEGCATYTIPLSNFFKIPKALQDTLEIVAEMEEEGTGITHSQNKRVIISYAIGKLSFFDTSKVYKPGTALDGKVRAVSFDDQPLRNMNLYLFEGEIWSSKRLLNLTTDNNGEATFSLDTTERNGDIRLHISDKVVLQYPGYRVAHYQTGEITVSMAPEASPDSKMVSFLVIEATEKTLACGTEEEIFIQYTLVNEAQHNLEMTYMVLSHREIVVTGSIQIVLTGSTVSEGRASFRLPINAALAPDFAVVAFIIMSSKSVIAGSAEFNTEKCFSHKVGVEFDPEQGVPGEDATLRVTGESNSLCGISVIDQSVLLQEPDKYLKADKIFNLLPRNRYVPYQAQDPTQCLLVRPKRSIFPHPGNADDAFTVFQNVGLKIFTNLMIQLPDCLSYKGREYHYGNRIVPYRLEGNEAFAAPGAAGGAGGDSLPPIETIRTFFPETWIWDLVVTGPNGVVGMPVKIPDTITTWETEAFCLSPQGFGLAPRTEFTVFQPFFLELSLPYSIIRGEDFQLKATVFSFLTSCMMVTVTPAPSSDYTLTPNPGVVTFCLCGTERKTISWNMSPTTLGSVNVTVTAEAVSSDVQCNNEPVLLPARGRIDTVTEKLIVKAEGVEVIDTYSLLLCPKHSTLTELINVQLPAIGIPGSARAMVSVIGDFLGRTMRNLDSLLRMPYGCGEQNMLLFAPNIYILEYLTETHQLTPEIEKKAENFLLKGYQRQLNYKHADGAYSAFGTGSGNTWLTAFVLRSFARAKKFIYIDPAKIAESQQWLESKQMKNGCFQKVGKLFHNKMKGGVSDEVTLTAYISAALLEMGVSADNTVLSNSLTCLKSSQGYFQNTYTTALMSYVFTLAQDSTFRDQLLNHLNSVAHNNGGLLYWTQASAQTSTSLSVELSSYVLLAKLGSASPTAAELGDAAKIVRWLIKQQNYNGGFSSTQDTVVALQALTRYSSLVYSPRGKSTVTVLPPGGAPLQFQVNQNNRLLYQEQSLTVRTGFHSVKVKGDACAAVQITLMYNIPVPNKPSPFQLEVMSKSNCNLLRPRMILNIKAKYRGEERETNMAVIDIKILSGFSVDPDSLNALKRERLVERVDKNEDNVLIYIDGLPRDVLVLYELLMIREVPVRNLKPAVIQMYDYYQPSDKVDTNYFFRC